LRAEAKKIRKEAKERSASMDREAAKYEHGV